MDFADHLRERHPDFPLRPELGGHGDPWAHLPPLPPAVEALAERYVESREIQAAAL
jgi:hypothetical protein